MTSQGQRSFEDPGIGLPGGEDACKHVALQLLEGIGSVQGGAKLSGHESALRRPDSSSGRSRCLKRTRGYMHEHDVVHRAPRPLPFRSTR